MNYTNENIREQEQDTIRSFVERSAKWFKGDVLDYGSGKSPYRSIVEGAGAKYIPYDRIDNPASCASTDVGPENPLYCPEKYDAILCTQVLQYIPQPWFLMDQFRVALKYQGALLMTGPTTWPQIEPEDLWRYTESGVRRLLCDYQISEFERRGDIDLEGFGLSLGWGVVAVK